MSLGSGTNYLGSNPVVSTVNSTTTILGASETFTGDWERAPRSMILCQSYADQTGTLFFDFSVDGANKDSTFPVNGSAASASIPLVKPAAVGGRFFRVRYVNDSTAQTEFRLETSFCDLTNFYTSLNDSLGLDASAIAVRPSDPQDEITRGVRGGARQLNKFSYRDGLTSAAGDQLIIADGTTNTPTILTSASTFTIAYNNATDGASTTGALTLQIDYLDSNFELQAGIHVLGSSGSDVTSFSGLGINRVVLVSSGSNDANGDDITVTATTGGSVQAFIPAGVSVTQQLWAHIPVNAVGVAKFLFLSALRVSGGGGGSPRVVWKVFVYNRFVETTYEVFRYQMDTDVENHLELVDPVNFGFSGRDVVWVTADTDTNNTDVSARLSLNIYDVS